MSRLRILLFLVLGLGIISSAGFAAPVTIKELGNGLTPSDLVKAIVGEGVAYQNVTYTGSDLGAGTFSSGSDAIGFDSGVVLSTGYVSGGSSCLASQNSQGGCGYTFSTSGDRDLDALIPGYYTEDASVLEFDFKPVSRVISFNYVFGSEEYNEYVNDKYNDVFGFFVNRKNIALIPGTTDPVSINNVNGGNPGSDKDHTKKNPEYFRNNVGNEGGGGIPIELDGLTTTLAATAPVNANEWNHIKLAIADAGDGKLDSAVFIQTGSFESKNLVLEPLSQEAATGSQVSLTASFPDKKQNAKITLSVVDGPNKGLQSPALMTDASGSVTWSYQGTKGGTDQVEARGDSITSNQAGIRWTQSGTTSTPPEYPVTPCGKDGTSGDGTTTTTGTKPGTTDTGEGTTSTTGTKPGTTDTGEGTTSTTGTKPGTTDTGEGTKPVSSGCIQIDKNSYIHGENMTVTWVGSSGYADNAWIGIIPSKAGHTEPDADAVNLPEPYWQYIGKKTGGTSIIPAPDQTGTYDFRMFDSDDGSIAKEVCSVTFTIVNNSPRSGCIVLDKTTYVHGEPMKVSWSGSPRYYADAWIGIIPADAPHTEPGADAVNLPEPYWEYIAQKTGGNPEYTAPDKTGNYEFRMFDGDANGNSQEICAAPFTVVNNSPRTGCIQLDKQTYQKGEKMRVTWTGSPLYYDDAWIGMIPSDAPHTEPGADAVNLPEPYWQYIAKKTGGENSFTAPTTPGRYDFRMFDGDANGNSQEICAVSFTVASG